MTMLASNKSYVLYAGDKSYPQYIGNVVAFRIDVRSDKPLQGGKLTLLVADAKKDNKCEPGEWRLYSFGGMCDPYDVEDGDYTFSQIAEDGTGKYHCVIGVPCISEPYVRVIITDVPDDSNITVSAATS